MSTTMKVPQHLGLDETKWYSPYEAAAVLRCSRSFVYDLMAREDLASVKSGRKRLIAGSSIANYLRSLAAAAS